MTFSTEHLHDCYQRLMLAGFSHEATDLMQAAYEAGQSALDTKVQSLYEDLNTVGWIEIDGITTIEVNEDGSGFTEYVEQDGLGAIKHIEFDQLMARLMKAAQQGA